MPLARTPAHPDTRTWRYRSLPRIPRPPSSDHAISAIGRSQPPGATGPRPDHQGPPLSRNVRLRLERTARAVPPRHGRHAPSVADRGLVPPNDAQRRRKGLLRRNFTAPHAAASPWLALRLPPTRALRAEINDAGPGCSLRSRPNSRCEDRHCRLSTHGFPAFLRSAGAPDCGAAAAQIQVRPTRTVCSFLTTSP
jgi:hypothetical protein